MKQTAVKSDKKVPPSVHIPYRATNLTDEELDRKLRLAVAWMKRHRVLRWGQ